MSVHSTRSKRFQHLENLGENFARSVKDSQRYPKEEKYLKEDKVSLELEHMRLQEQYRKEINLFQDEIFQLRQELDRCQELVREVENRELMQKQEMNNLHRENLKLYQEVEKNKKVISNLKNDNQALELELERWKSERKTYSSKLDSIYELKKNMNEEIAQKNTLIEEQQARIKEQEKKLAEFRLKVEEISGSLAQKQRENKQLSGEVRTHLQHFFQSSNNLSKLQHQAKALKDLNQSLRQKVFSLEKDKENYQERILELGGSEEYETGNYSLQQRKNRAFQENEYVISPTDERIMLEIQSFMRQFQGLLDRKLEQRKNADFYEEKLATAIESIQEALQK